jgi:DNA-directed RNA polymerase specialized sigma24 family protein
VIETVLRDRPYADVAAELGVAPGTLRTRVHYGLRRQRCVLETADAALELLTEWILKEIDHGGC